MKSINKLSGYLKGVIIFVALLVVLYLILKIFEDIKIFFSIITLSFGVLAIIWTLLAKYSLSPKSTLRLFTNNFLTCSISILAFTIFRFLSDFIPIPELIYLEFFFISVPRAAPAWPRPSARSRARCSRPTCARWSGPSRRGPSRAAP
jgi:hypothetical protein